MLSSYRIMLRGVLPPSLIRSVIDVAKADDTPVIVDPKGRDYARYAGATLLTPNLKRTASRHRACLPPGMRTSSPLHNRYVKATASTISWLPARRTA